MMTNLKETAESAIEMGKHVKDSVASFGENAANKVAEVREGTGKALHSVAGSARRSSDAIDSAADKLDAAGFFVQSCNMKNTLNRLGDFGRSNLVGSLIIAGVVGFMAARALQSRA